MRPRTLVAATVAVAMLAMLAGCGPSQEQRAALAEAQAAHAEQAAARARDAANKALAASQQATVAADRAAKNVEEATKALNAASDRLEQMDRQLEQRRHERLRHHARAGTITKTPESKSAAAAAPSP